MRRRIRICIGFLSLMLTLTACHQEEKNSSEETAQQEEASVQEKVKTELVEEENLLYKGAAGYTMIYAPSVFQLKESESGETFTYIGENQLNAPVYIAIQAYEELDAKTLADGLILQSGQKRVEVMDALFGADSLEVKLIKMEKEENAVIKTQIFYVISREEKPLLVEVGGYQGMPEDAELRLEEMLAKFHVEE